MNNARAEAFALRPGAILFYYVGKFALAREKCKALYDLIKIYIYLIVLWNALFHNT